MTDREKAIVMAYTGIAMLVGDKINEYYKYLAELYGRPVYTHELVNLDIASKAKSDFIKLCQDEQPEQHWIPVEERLPKAYEDCLWTTTDGRVVLYYCDGMFSKYTAWMPLPKPYREKNCQQEGMTFKLNHPLTEEQWDAITDVDMEHTPMIEFHTKNGKIVKYRKVEEE